MAELADAQVSGACGVTPVWVQVPPLASTSRPSRLFTVKRPTRTLGVLAITLLAACSHFEKPEPLGPPNAVLARSGGPAASIAVAGDRVTIAFASAQGHAQRIWAADVPPHPAAPEIQELPAAKERVDHTPLAIAGPEQSMTLVWLQSSKRLGGRVAWSESPAPSAAFSSPRDAGQEFSTPPRGGGHPATFVAAQERPISPGSTRHLQAWQRSPGNEVGISALRPTFEGRALGATALGWAAGKAVVTWVDGNRDIVLGSSGGSDAAPRTVIQRSPAGPGFVWLGKQGSEVIAAWSEFTPGRSRASRVSISLSSDMGRNWTSPRELMAAKNGEHPMAAFAWEASTVAAVWRASEGSNQRIFLSVSEDSGKTFSAPMAVDDPADDSRLSQPSLAIFDQRILVAWRAQSDSGSRILASSSNDAGRHLAFRAKTVNTPSSDREVAHPQAWLADTQGGILWESRVGPTLAPGRPPGNPNMRPTVSLTLRRLRG